VCVCVCVCVLTGQRGEVGLDVQLLQEDGGGQVDGEVAPRLLGQEDVGPGGGACAAVRGRGLQQHLGRLCRGAAGRDGAWWGVRNVRLNKALGRREHLAEVQELAGDTI